MRTASAGGSRLSARKRRTLRVGRGVDVDRERRERVLRRCSGTGSRRCARRPRCRTRAAAGAERRSARRAGPRRAGAARSSGSGCEARGRLAPIRRPETQRQPAEAAPERSTRNEAPRELGCHTRSSRCGAADRQAALEPVMRTRGAAGRWRRPIGVGTRDRDAVPAEARRSSSRSLTKEHAHEEPRLDATDRPRPCRPPTTKRRRHCWADWSSMPRRRATPSRGRPATRTIGRQAASSATLVVVRADLSRLDWPRFDLG